MSDHDVLNVWNEARPVGRLWQNAFSYIGFRYDPSWIDAGGFAVSRTIPVSAADFAPEDGVAHRFFANLLPRVAFAIGSFVSSRSRTPTSSCCARSAASAPVRSASCLRTGLLPWSQAIVRCRSTS